MELSMTPRGVCARRFNFQLLPDGTIKSLEILGGCDGNLKGISALIRGRKAEDVIPLLAGISCGGKETSCPDQIAQALRHALGNTDKANAG